MPEAEDPYLGREHSKIKHEFLSRYLIEASFKILQTQDRNPVFNYVDGFAGPWSVSDDDSYNDSSFANAIQVLEGTKEHLLKAGRQSIEMRFFLCEKNPTRFAKLEAYAQSRTGIAIKVFFGPFEDHLKAIEKACEGGFTFTFIDPTGWNLRSAEIAAFLSRLRGDFLLNFMSAPIARHSSFQAVEESFCRFLDDRDWRDKLPGMPDHLSTEEKILRVFKLRLRELKAARYLPDFPILRPREDRIQMRLLLGTNHLAGVEVFRTTQKKVEDLQASIRRGIANDGVHQISIFSDSQLNQMELGDAGVGGREHVTAAKRTISFLLEQVNKPVRFDSLAVRVMEQHSLKKTNVKDILVEMKKAGMLEFSLEARATKPSDSTLISR